jgi:small subunit ribosomal protein S4
MGRHLDAVCRLCRREGIKLFLKGERCESPKCAIERRNTPPGMHGYRKGKSSEYGVRLREKQKLKRFYGVFERQFRRLFEIASRSPENTGEVLLSLMERRLDNIVHRLGFISNRAGARQFITHGHILVNGRCVNIPSFLVKPGDVITVKDRPKSRALARLHLEKAVPTPEYLERVSADPPEGKVLRLPARGDVDPNISQEIQEQLIIELSAR